MPITVALYLRHIVRHAEHQVAEIYRASDSCVEPRADRLILLHDFCRTAQFAHAVDCVRLRVWGVRGRPRFRDWRITDFATADLMVSNR